MPSLAKEIMALGRIDLGYLIMAYLEDNYQVEPGHLVRVDFSTDVCNISLHWYHIASIVDNQVQVYMTEDRTGVCTPGAPSIVLSANDPRIDLFESYVRILRSQKHYYGSCCSLEPRGKQR